MKRSMSSVRSNLSSMADACTANLFVLSMMSELHTLREENNYTGPVASCNWRRSCLPCYDFFEPVCEPEYEPVSQLAHEPVSESAPIRYDKQTSDIKSEPMKTKKGIEWINCYFYGFYMKTDELNRYKSSIEEGTSSWSPKRVNTSRTEYPQVKKYPTEDGRHKCFPNINSCSQS